MENDMIQNLYDVVQERLKSREEGSYTCYLFDQGLDKILKKVGEENAETIIAAKNGENGRTTEEMADLLYHLVVLMAQQGIRPAELDAVLRKRNQKTGNLKKFHQVNKNT